jgi:phosphoenolpyruvate synthase/pyruvate phosphate dikinase
LASWGDRFITRSSPIPSALLHRPQETSPEDVGGMHAAEGILTSRGGMTSHAAVVARGWGKPCVCGCEALTIDEKRGVITVNATHQEFKAGAYIR